LALSSTAPPGENLFQGLQTPQAPYLNPSPARTRTTQDDLAAIAYVGSLLLTADQVVRSVDSLMESMKVEAPDGSVLRLDMWPGSKGFEMMLRVTRPL